MFSTPCIKVLNVALSVLRTVVVGCEVIKARLAASRFLVLAQSFDATSTALPTSSPPLLGRLPAAPASSRKLCMFLLATEASASFLPASEYSCKNIACKSL